MLLDPGSGCASPLSIDGIAFGVVTWSTSRISTVQVGQMVLDHYKEDIQRYSTWPDLQLDPRMPDQPAKSESESKKVQVLIISALMT